MLSILNEYLDNLTLYKARAIHINGKKLYTPAKAVDKSVVKSDAFLDYVDQYREYSNFLIEIHFRASREDHLNLISSSFNKLISRLGDEFIYLGLVSITKELFISIISKRLEKYINLFSNELLNTGADIVSTPYVPYANKFKLYDNKLVKKYSDFLKGVAMNLNESGKYTVMGVIQDISDIKTMTELVQLYLGLNNIKIIGFNFDAKVPSSVYSFLQSIFREVRRISSLARFVYYALNVNKGRYISSLDCIPARDVMVFGYGFDILGEKHIAVPSRERERGYIMIFNQDTYGYDKVSYRGIKRIYLQEKILNFPKYLSEFHNIHVLLREGGAIKEYLSNKKCIHRVDHENIFKLKEDLFKQLSLFDKIREFI